jgi:hypothetical protein
MTSYRTVVMSALAVYVVAGQTGFAQNLPKSAKTVKVLALDTYGNVLRGCRIRHFLDLATKDDRSELFRGLNGTNVPYGEYSVSAACDDNTGASSILVVNRPDTFLVAASARHVADSTPGGGPEFLVKVSNWHDFPNKVWIQLASVFRDERFVDEVHMDSGEAHLSFELPGLYVLTVFAGGEILCRQPVKIDSVGGDLTVQAGGICTMLSSHGVALRESAPPIRPQSLQTH